MSRSRPALARAVLLVAPALAAPCQTSLFQYGRLIEHAQAGQPTCAVLDPALFPHAAPGLRDLRLFSAEAVPVETPYVLTVSEASSSDVDSALIVRPTARGNTLEFDLAMPRRPYTEVDLALLAQNFVGTAIVTGKRSSADAQPMFLGQFAVFDLSSRHLPRSTALPLAESAFPLLHVRLELHAFPGAAPLRLTPLLLRPATVPPSREGQILYTAALSAPVVTSGQASVATFNLPPRLPVQRIRIRLAPGHTGSFVRSVRLEARGDGDDAPEIASGTIAHVDLTVAGQHLTLDQPTFDATLGANLQHAARLVVAVNNGAAPPLPIRAVELEVRERRLCFTPRTDQLTLFYGDPDLRAPQYRNSAPLAPVSIAALGPEFTNPQWQPEPELPRSERRHPHLVWLVLLGLSLLLAVVAFRASRAVHR